MPKQIAVILTVPDHVTPDSVRHWIEASRDLSIDEFKNVQVDRCHEFDAINITVHGELPEE